jgi:hypothetical protein
VGSTPTGAWIFVCCECRVLSGRGLCDELIARPEEFYRLCCVVVCDLEISRICTPYIYIYIYIYDISHLRVNISQHMLHVTGIVLKQSSLLRVTFFRTKSSYQAQSSRSTNLQCNLEHTGLYFLLDTSRSHGGFRRKSTVSLVR